MFKNFMSCCLQKGATDPGEISTNSNILPSIGIEYRNKSFNKRFGGEERAEELDVQFNNYETTRAKNLCSGFSIDTTRLSSNIKITEKEINENPKLELRELEGNILNRNILIINAAGIESHGLRDAKDGISYFGLVMQKNGITINDFVLYIPNDFGAEYTTVFKIFFDRLTRNYFLSHSNLEKDSILFVKLDNPMVIYKKHIISLGEVNFSVEVNPFDLSLKIEISLGNEITKSKFFHCDSNPVVRIGRNKDNDFVIENCAYSRIHTSIMFNSTKNFWVVQDGYENKNSTNGTWVYLDFPWKIENVVHFKIGSNYLRIRRL